MSIDSGNIRLLSKVNNTSVTSDFNVSCSSNVIVLR
jgi:hypothetical protein